VVFKGIASQIVVFKGIASQIVVFKGIASQITKHINKLDFAFKCYSFYD